MKTIKIKNITYCIFGFGFLLALAIFTTPGITYAGGSQTDQGIVGSVCYNPSTGEISVPENESQASACSSSGSTLVQPGQPLPVRACLADGRVQKISDVSSSAEACSAIGGQVVEPNQPLPSFFVKTNAEAAAASGKGVDAPNQGESLESPVPINNEDRERLVNCDGDSDPGKCLDQNPIVQRLVQAINIISVGVGVIVTIMIIIGGIQYASAGGNAQKVQAAKTHITNAIIALIAYFFLFAFLQWVVPGGIF